MTRRLQFRDSILLPHVPAHSTDLEGKARRSEVLAEVQGDLGGVLQARALEDPALCLLKRTVEARAADGHRLVNLILFALAQGWRMLM